MTIVPLRPGDTVTIVAINPDVHPSHPIMLPGMPGWGVPPGARPSHPIALPGDPWWGGGGVVDPGYGIDVGTGVPPRPTHPIALPGDPWWGTSPPTEPPPTQPPPQDSGNYLWAWSPQLQRWIWVKIPAEGEAAPKA